MYYWYKLEHLQMVHNLLQLHERRDPEKGRDNEREKQTQISQHTRYLPCQANTPHSDK